MSAHVKHVNLNSINNTNIHLHFIYVLHPLLSMLSILRGTTLTIGMLFYIQSNLFNRSGGSVNRSSRYQSLAVIMDIYKYHCLCNLSTRSTSGIEINLSFTAAMYNPLKWPSIGFYDVN